MKVVVKDKLNRFDAMTGERTCIFVMESEGKNKAGVALMRAEVAVVGAQNIDQFDRGVSAFEVSVAPYAQPADAPANDLKAADLKAVEAVTLGEESHAMSTAELLPHTETQPVVEATPADAEVPPVVPAEDPAPTPPPAEEPAVPVGTEPHQEQ